MSAIEAAASPTSGVRQHGSREDQAHGQQKDREEARTGRRQRSRSRVASLRCREHVPAGDPLNDDFAEDLTGWRSARLAHHDATDSRSCRGL